MYIGCWEEEVEYFKMVFVTMERGCNEGGLRNEYFENWKSVLVVVTDFRCLGMWNRCIFLGDESFITVNVYI